MNDINLKIEELKVQVMRMQAARAELNFKVLERKKDIQRIEKEIQNQDLAIARVQELITAEETK